MMINNNTVLKEDKMNKKDRKQTGISLIKHWQNDRMKEIEEKHGLHSFVGKIENDINSALLKAVGKMSSYDVGNLVYLMIKIEERAGK
jgi:hypothetical protein